MEGEKEIIQIERERSITLRMFEIVIGNPLTLKYLYST